MIEIPEYKKEQAETIKGIHKPIIDIELFRRVQNVLDGRKNSDAKFPTSENESFPLRGNLVCPNCGKQITASKSKGNGGRYEYYHCKSSCRIRLKKEIVHERIQNLLNTDASVESENERRKNEIMDTIADISMANKTLNWSPKISFIEGIQNILNKH